MSADEPPVFEGVPVRGCYHYREKGACAASHALCVGDGVLLEREPHNPYDGSAIAVTTEEGVPLGHIAREVAAEVAPWMDAGWVFVAVKTSRIDLMCWTILTLYPITPSYSENEKDAFLADLVDELLTPEEA